VRRGLDADLAGLELEGRRTLVALAECVDAAGHQLDGYKVAQTSGELRKVLAELVPAGGGDDLDELLAALGAGDDDL
jgi:hypothetical protein